MFCTVSQQVYNLLFIFILNVLHGQPARASEYNHFDHSHDSASNYMVICTMLDSSLFYSGLVQ